MSVIADRWSGESVALSSQITDHNRPPSTVKNSYGTERAVARYQAR